MLKNRFIYGSMLILSIVSLGMSGNRGSYIMLLFLLILAVISLAVAFVSTIGLEINQELSSGIVMKNEACQFRAQIKSRFFSMSTLYVNFAPMPVSVAFTPPDKSSYELLFNRDIEITAGIKGKYRGVFQVGIESVEIHDFLKIFRFRKKIEAMPYIMICPAVVDFSMDILSQSPSEQAGISKHTTIEDYSSISDIRPFHHSDSIKKVHWKLSAKKDELMVKNYDATNTTVTAIIIDNRLTPDIILEKEALEDSLIEFAVSIVKYYLSSGQPVILDYIEDEKPARLYENSGAGFDRLYFACAGVMLNKKSIDDLLSDYYNPNFLLSSVYVLSVNPDREIDVFVKNMASSGHEINLVHFYENQAENRLDRYKGTGVNYYGIQS